MCICTCMWIWVCMVTCMCMCKYICVCVCIWVVYVNVYRDAYVCKNVFVNIFVCVFVFCFVFVYVFVYLYKLVNVWVFVMYIFVYVSGQVYVSAYASANVYVCQSLIQKTIFRLDGNKGRKWEQVHTDDQIAINFWWYWFLRNLKLIHPKIFIEENRKSQLLKTRTCHRNSDGPGRIPVAPSWRQRRSWQTHRLQHTSAMSEIQCS